jgi:hypothetical protein
VVGYFEALQNDATRDSFNRELDAAICDELVKCAVEITQREQAQRLEN